MGSPENAAARVLTELHRFGGEAGRNQLTDSLGSPRNVIGYALRELEARGLVEVRREGSATPTRDSGRPSHHVTIAEDAPAAIAAELNSDGIAVATISFGGRILHRDAHAAAQLEPDAAADALSELILAHASAHPRVLGVGVSVPSPVRARDGLALGALHLGWPPVPFRKLLAERLGPISLVLANDAQLAALAEHRHGAGRDAIQMLYLTTAPTGLGGALISAGQAFTGANGYGMEPGHIPVKPGGTPCRCGSAGCLDVEADNRALLRAVGKAQRDPGTVARRAEALLRAAAEKDPDAVAAADHVRGVLADGLVSLVNLTDPDRIVLGGSLARLHDLAPESIPGQLLQHSFLERAGPIPVLRGVLPHPFLLGAAELVLQPVLDNPLSLTT